MDRDTPSLYRADNFCVDCGKGIDPAQADLSYHVGRAERCRRCHDRATRESRLSLGDRPWHNR